MFYALSMFDTPDNLKNYFSGLFQKKPQVKDELGDFIAKSTLNPGFGYYNKPNAKGHFSFWALDDFNYLDHFVINERM